MSHENHRDLGPWSLLNEEGPKRGTPSQEGLWKGGLFLSHSGEDWKTICDNIYFPVLFDRFHGDGCFLHNRGSGGAHVYRDLIHLGLHLCEKFMCALSARSAQNDWVKAEVEWARLHNRPIIVARLDDTSPDALFATHALPKGEAYDLRTTIDFRLDIDTAQLQLGAALDGLLQELPYPRALSFHDHPKE
jgi:hypothetical protein